MLFDQGIEDKKAGMAKAAENRSYILSVARGIAVTLASRKSTRLLSADDVYEKLSEFEQEQLGPAAGNIFFGPRWEFTGHWIQSKRVSNRGRYIRIWRLK